MIAVKSFLAFVSGMVFAFVGGSGFYLMSNTEYPFWRTVGGASLVGGCIVFLVAFLWFAEES